MKEEREAAAQILARKDRPARQAGLLNFLEDRGYSVSWRSFGWKIHSPAGTISNIEGFVELERYVDQLPK